MPPFFCTKNTFKSYINMILVKEQLTPQQINFIVRESLAQDFYLIDENTNVSVLVPNIQVLPNDYYTAAYGVFPTKENHFYWLMIYNANQNLILKERMFCTNQPKGTFSVNNGQYLSNQTTNDFIMYE
jgi:hypothetical protein